MNFKEAQNQLTGRNRISRKLANNTYLQRHNDDIAVLLHETDIVTFKANGDTILNSGGWRTPTTKNRINGYIPSPFHLITERGVWYIVENTNGYYWDKNNTRLRFQDGIIITAKGKVINFAKDIPKADKDIKRRVKDYAQLCADAVPLDKPDGGDCWYCYMATDKGQSLGNAIKNVDHLKQHMKDKYIVPSLVYRALEQYYNAKMAFWQAFKDTGYPEDTDREFGKQAVKKAVYRYIMRHFNYAV